MLLRKYLSLNASFDRIVNKKLLYVCTYIYLQLQGFKRKQRFDLECFKCLPKMHKLSSVLLAMRFYE